MVAGRNSFKRWRFGRVIGRYASASHAVGNTFALRKQMRDIKAFGFELFVHGVARVPELQVVRECPHLFVWDDRVHVLRGGCRRRRVFQIQARRRSGHKSINQNLVIQTRVQRQQQTLRMGMNKLMQQPAIEGESTLRRSTFTAVNPRSSRQTRRMWNWSASTGTAGSSASKPPKIVLRLEGLTALRDVKRITATQFSSCASRATWFASSPGVPNRGGNDRISRAPGDKDGVTSATASLALIAAAPPRAAELAHPDHARSKSIRAIRPVVPSPTAVAAPAARPAPTSAKTALLESCAS